LGELVLAVDEQAEAFFEGETRDGGGGALLAQGLGDAGKAPGVEAVDEGLLEHGSVPHLR
jgi:hypothetical protein